MSRTIWSIAAPLAVIVSALAVAVSCESQNNQPETEQARRNIVLVTVDTLRADHLEAYGYPTATAPHLARMTKRGILFEHAISQAPWTLASMASVHTSLMPSEHGVVLNSTRIPGDVTTLAEALSAAGYKTLGVVSHSYVGRHFGFARGFDQFDQSQIKGHEAVTSADLTRVAVARLAKMIDTSSDAFFLWVHYFDPHFGYVHQPSVGFVEVDDDTRPESVPGDMLLEPQKYLPASLEHIVGLYDEEIRHTDARSVNSSTVSSLWGWRTRQSPS